MSWFIKILDRLLERLFHIIGPRYKAFDMRQLYVHGNPNRLHIGKNVSSVNTIFNTASGHIYVGDDTIFGHNCMVLTGKHIFENGMRRRLSTGGSDIVHEGQDIRIGRGCWIASGSIITGGVIIGDHSIVAAGAVVTKDIPSGVFAAGVPAKVVKTLQD